MKGKQLTTIQKKKRKFMLVSGVMAAVLTAVVVFGVMLAYKIPGKYDMTGQKLFTLSEETKAVVDGVGQQVKIAAVYPEGNEDAMMKALLDEYALLSPDLEVRYIDAEKNPSVLADYDIGDASAVANGTIIVNSGDRHKLISSSQLFTSGETGNIFYGESEVTGAIRYVTTEDLPKVYFVQGHGEVAPGTDMGEAVAMLERNAYDVDTVTLVQYGSVPEDADVLLFASPKEDLADEEAAMVEEFLSRGGKLFYMTDPVLSSNADKMEHFGELLSGYGIDISNNYVYEEDSSHYLTVSNLYLIPLYGVHEITEQLINEQELVVLPVAQGLGELGDTVDVTLKPLLQSSPSSWERDDMTVSSAQMTEKDIPGPVTLAWAATRGNAETGSQSSGVVAIGDSNFAVDGNIGMQANGDFFINSVNWLSGGREAEVIAGKVVNASSLVVRGSDFMRLMVICCVVMPAVMFVGAALVWKMRKNK